MARNDRKEQEEQLPSALRKKRIKKIIVVAFILMEMLGLVCAISYSNVGQNSTYVGMGESIELRAKWTPVDGPFNIEGAAYTGNLSVVGYNAALGGIEGPKNNGIYLYTTDNINKDVRWWNLSTADDITTGTLISDFWIGGYDIYPGGLTFNPQGTKLYIVGEKGDIILAFNLSQAWNTSSSVYWNNLSVSAQDTSPEDVALNNDGTKIYFVGSANDKVYEYNLSTPYDLSTAVYNDYLSVSAQDTLPTGLTFNNDGTKLYVMGGSTKKVYEYALSTPYDISTGTYTGKSYDVSAQDTSPYGVRFSADGTKMYFIGFSNDLAYQYDLKYPLDTAILSINISGNWENVSTIDLGGARTATWSNFSYSNSTICNKIVGWKIYANDSSGTTNVTPVNTFYQMPYLNVGSGSLTCQNEHNATLTQTASQDVSLYMSFFVRNATFKECSYTCNNCDKMNITNATEYCIINATTKDVTSVRFDEGEFISAFPPSNLPAVLAGTVAVIIIVVYTYTTRRKATGW